MLWMLPAQPVTVGTQPERVGPSWGRRLYRRCQLADLLILDLRVCMRRRIAIPHISHASWLLERGGLYQVRDISSSCVCCARLLWRVLDIDQAGLVVAD